MASAFDRMCSCGNTLTFVEGQRSKVCALCGLTVTSIPGPPYEKPSIDPLVDLSNDADFVCLSHVPESRPSRYVVQIRRFNAVDNGYFISQTSEHLGRHEAKELAMQWAHWHRLEVR